ncbi:MAG: phosphatidylserine decarboxylase, partial [Aurantibacter sp.]
IYNKPFTKTIIKPYIRINYGQLNYLENFKPPHGKKDYESFQDFFIREFKSLPKNPELSVWPCEGLLCETEKVERLSTSMVKCDERKIAVIFGVADDEIPKNYSYTNVFLHNKNYHRIHAPIAGKITRIQHIPGDLVVLRPWIYKQNPSIPAFRNERFNIDITGKDGRVWYLSIVGGPAVGTIELPKNISKGAKVDKLQELALFYLGSTCCMATPRAPRFHRKNSFVAVGESY